MLGGNWLRLCDGGVRRGTDILKALALGARAWSAGRPHLSGFGAGGEAGVGQALKILKTALARDMALLGRPTVRDVDASLVRKVGASWR